MKSKILILGTLILFLSYACNDYLDVKSDSKFDSEFIFQSVTEADKAVLGAYQLVSTESNIHSIGLYYHVFSVGSDIEVGPEVPTFGGRYTHENCYNLAPQLSDMPVTSWDGMYKTINRCNILMEAFEQNEAFIKADKTKPSELVHLYGEVVAIRATMYDVLTRCWGDVIYSTKPIASKADYEGVEVTDRTTIQEGELKKLMEVEPMMFHLNTGGDQRSAVRMTKEYVQGLIGRIALARGGFALRPASYAGDGEVIQSHPVWGKMVRRTDYKDYYKLANTYLKKVVNEGNAIFTTTDPRTPAEKYSNPFQYIFQQSMDYKISKESIFEVSIKVGDTSEYPYSQGRPSDGGTNGYPPKGYGQVRFFPTYYYGMFNPKDMRRDVTVTSTALGGVANEKMLSFKKGNKSNGGLALNKWDYSRMADKTYAITQRIAGINAPYMRLNDIILLLAETDCMLGNYADAKAGLLKIRQRAFNPNDPEYAALTSTYVGSLSGDALMNAIQDERALELGGEGYRRYDLVRWGILGKKINQVQTEMTQVINGLSSKGSYQFANGNTISQYIYTKSVSLAESGLNDLLTTTCYVDKTDPKYSLLYPAWRGTFTAWNAASGTKLLNVMMSIEGMFEPVTTEKAADLVTRGYKKTAWGIDLMNEVYGANINGIFGGYLPADYTANYPPRYILAIPATTIAYSQGKVSNSYGFPNQ